MDALQYMRSTVISPISPTIFFKRSSNLKPALRAVPSFCSDDGYTFKSGVFSIGKQSSCWSQINRIGLIITLKIHITARITECASSVNDNNFESECRRQVLDFCAQ